MSLVEKEYQARVDAMSVTEKMRRSVAMLQWARNMIAREIRTANPSISDERLKWEVAMRQYGSEPQARALIQRMLDRVSC